MWLFSTSARFPRRLQHESIEEKTDAGDVPEDVCDKGDHSCSDRSSVMNGMDAFWQNQAATFAHRGRTRNGSRSGYEDETLAERRAVDSEQLTMWHKDHSNTIRRGINIQDMTAGPNEVHFDVQTGNGAFIFRGRAKECERAIKYGMGKRLSGGASYGS